MKNALKGRLPIKTNVIHVLDYQAAQKTDKLIPLVIRSRKVIIGMVLISESFYSLFKMNENCLFYFYSLVLNESTFRTLSY